MEAQAQRQTAIKIRIGDLKSSRYTKTDGDWEPNYALTPYNTKVSRVNIMGAVVSSEDGNSFVLDDGTANIVVRSFEPISVPEIGDITVVIGRIREFSEQIYVIPEIVKKIEKNIESWLKLRKLELDDLSR